MSSGQRVEKWQDCKHSYRNPVVKWEGLVDTTLYDLIDKGWDVTLKSKVYRDYFGDSIAHKEYIYIRHPETKLIGRVKYHAVEDPDNLELEYLTTEHNGKIKKPTIFEIDTMISNVETVRLHDKFGHVIRGKLTVGNNVKLFSHVIDDTQLMEDINRVHGSRLVADNVTDTLENIAKEQRKTLKKKPKKKLTQAEVHDITNRYAGVRK